MAGEANGGGTPPEPPFELDRSDAAGHSPAEGHGNGPCIACPDCRGGGRVTLLTSSAPCATCSGTGRIPALPEPPESPASPPREPEDNATYPGWAGVCGTEVSRTEYDADGRADAVVRTVYDQQGRVLCVTWEGTGGGISVFYSYCGADEDAASGSSSWDADAVLPD